MRKFLTTALIALVGAFGVTACGGNSGVTHHSVQHQTTRVTTVCSGLTDQCHTFVPPVSTHRFAATASHCKIPDVSSFQGHPNWAAAKSSICGGIFKGGEYVQDPDAAYNNNALRSLHIWRAMYWFVRNTGCSHEASQITSLAHALGVKVVINDMERPEAAGYATCLVPAEKAAGLIAVDYTAPGTWPGGPGFANAPLWQAEYGPTLHPFWNPVVAWQCSDGQFGCVTHIAGIPLGDMSLNLGITNLGGISKTICWGNGSTPNSNGCPAIRAQAHALWVSYKSLQQQANTKKSAHSTIVKAHTG